MYSVHCTLYTMGLMDTSKTEQQFNFIGSGFFLFKILMFLNLWNLPPPPSSPWIDYWSGLWFKLGFDGFCKLIKPSLNNWRFQPPPPYPPHLPSLFIRQYGFCFKVDVFRLWLILIALDNFSKLFSNKFH